MNRGTRELIGIGAVVFFIAAITALSLLLLRPFYTPAIFAVAVTIALHPLKKVLLKIARGRRTLVSGAMTFLVFVIMLGVLLPVSISLVNESRHLYQMLKESVSDVEEEWVEKLGDITSSLFGEGEKIFYNLLLKIADYIKNISKAFLNLAFSLLKGAFSMAFKLLVFFIFLFFFFRDGEEIVKLVFGYIPLDEELKEKIKMRLHGTLSAVLIGTFLTAFIQGFLAGMGFLVLGVPFPAILGLLAGMCSILPFGGTALVWMPVAGYLFVKGETVRGIIQLVWGGAIVSTIDNLLKPLIIGKEMRVSFLWMFLFLLGGIKIFGFAGIFAGPMILSLLKVAGEFMREKTV